MGKLILGDGLLGSELVKQTNWNYISRRKDGFNINNSDSWDFEKYDTIINCIAYTKTEDNTRDVHWDINYRFLYDLINYCNSYNKKLVHISTDYLYTNSNNNASEIDVPVHCNNWYGYTKLLGDGLIQLLAKDYLLIRCTHKPYPFPYDKAWVDQIGNFDYVYIISDLIIKLINSNSSGLYNLGTEKKSMYDLAIRSNLNVTPILSPLNTPKNVTMSVEKLSLTLI